MPTWVSLFFSFFLPPLGLVALAPHLIPVDGHDPSPIITLSYTLPGIATSPWAVEKKRAERAAWCGCGCVGAWVVCFKHAKQRRTSVENQTNCTNGGESRRGGSPWWAKESDRRSASKVNDPIITMPTACRLSQAGDGSRMACEYDGVNGY